MLRSLAALLLLSLLLVNAAAAAPDYGARGPYAVGYREVKYVKASETTGEPRELDTLIWYPAVPRTGTPTGTKLTDAEVVHDRWPLILFSHGSCGIPGQSPFYTEGLASWGFVVAAPPHPGNTTLELDHCSDPDRLADSYANRVADIRFVLDQLSAAAEDPSSPFYHRIDPRRIGMSGHSFGGQTTLRVAAVEPRVIGSVALAPAVGAALETLTIKSPLLVFGAELDSLTPFETASRDAFSLLDGPRYLIEIENTGHCAFALGCVPSLCGAGCEPGTLTPDETHRITLEYAVPFFLKYVAGRARTGSSILPDPTPPDVIVHDAFPGAPVGFFKPGLGGRPLRR
jgi:predicted dienelactone hydrolase